ncbi:MAG: hemolysin family protein [Acidimicrobiia bacterium]
MNFGALFWMIVLLLANGFFVASEFAFTAARRQVIEDLPGRGARAAVVTMRNLPDALAGAQVGITLATLLLGFVAEPAVAGIIESLIGWLPMPPGVTHTVSLIVALLLVVFLHMVIGEMAPKNIAIATPERLAVLLSVPFRWFLTLFRPLIATVNGVAKLVLRLFGVEPRGKLETVHSAEDLAVVIAAGRQEGIFEEFASKLLSGAIRFSERDASDVMVPRPDIVARPTDATPRQLEQIINDEGFSRIPIIGSNIDDLIGFVHAKDLLSVADEDYDQPIKPALIRPLLAVPESASIRLLLHEMQRSGRHLALIVDEHGGTAGLLTLEDIAEELVGDIRDEYDAGEDTPRQLTGRDRYHVPGAIRPDELRNLTGLKLPEGEYETLGGYVMDRLGRIARKGDKVDVENWTIWVKQMDGRRVTELELQKI